MNSLLMRSSQQAYRTILSSSTALTAAFVFSVVTTVSGFAHAQAQGPSPSPTPGTSCDLPKEDPTVTSNFLSSIDSAQYFSELAQVSKQGTFVKFLIDQKTDRITFQNTLLYPFHLDFIRKTIPELKAISSADYETLLFSMFKRFSAGALYWSPCVQLPNVSGKGALGFNLYFKKNPDLAEIQQTYQKIQNAISKTKKSLVFIFDRKEDWNQNQAALLAQGIPSTTIESFLNLSDQVQIYNPGVSYGYLKNLSSVELTNYEYDSTDILVLEKVPLDIGPVSGVLSAQVIVPNSHVLLRAINQKIPAAYLPKATNFADVQKNLGQLVELSVKPDGQITIQGAQQIGAAELQKRFENYRKSRVAKLPPPVFDLSLTSVRPFTTSSDASVQADEVRFYGAKATNLARIDQALRKQSIPRDHFNKSFLIPFAHYAKHVNQLLDPKVCSKAEKSCLKENTLHCQTLSALCLKSAATSTKIQSFIDDLINGKSLPEFKTKRDVRKSSLSFIRAVVKKSPLPSDSESYLTAALKQNFQPNQRIRFRSSTNAEDLPGLNGAGLYQSKAGCLADDANKDENGSSACMTNLEKERLLAMIAKLKSLNQAQYKTQIEELEEDLTKKKPVSGAIRGVYASLWTDKAFLNREYYGIPHQLVYMGILVHPSFSDESANGVLIVKQKEAGIFEMNVVTQKDDISITNPAYPGAVPEQLLIQFGAQQKSHVQVLQRSNLTNGKHVLNSSQIQDLARQVQITYETIGSTSAKGKISVLDIEFIIGAQGNVLMKQARPLNEESVTATAPKPPVQLPDNPNDDPIGPNLTCPNGFGLPMPLPTSSYKVDTDGISIKTELCIGLIGTSGGKFYQTKRVIIRDTNPSLPPAEQKRFVFQQNQVADSTDAGSINFSVIQTITHHNENDSLLIKLPSATYRIQVAGDHSSGFSSTLFVEYKNGTSKQLNLQSGNIIVK